MSQVWGTLSGWVLPRAERASDGAYGWPVWWAVGGWVVAVTLAAAGGGLAMGLGAPDNGGAALLASQSGLWLGFLATAVMASRVFGTGGLGVDFGLRISSAMAGRAVVVGVVTQLVVVPLVYLPLWLAGVDLDVSGPAESLLEGLTAVERALVAAGVVVLAPVTEELLFRGVLLRGLARTVSSRGAAWGSALLFAGTHFQLVQFPALVAVGLVLAWLALRTGGLAAPVWAHAGFNATTVVVLW